MTDKPLSKIHNGPPDIGPVYDTGQTGRTDHTGFYDYVGRRPLPCDYAALAEADRRLRDAA